MEIFQELVFTISFSLIVCLLIAKLFSISSSFDGGNSTVEERIKKEGKSDCFEDRLKGSDEVDFGVVIDGDESGSGVCACYVFDESPERSEDIDGLVKSDEGNVVNLTRSLVKEDCVMEETESGGEVGACYVFDESPERSEDIDADDGLVKSDEGNVVNLTGSLVKEDCVRFIEVKQVIEDTESGSGVGECHVFDESPQRTESNEAGDGLVKSDEGNVVNFTGSIVQEDCVKSVEVEQEEDDMFDDDWQGIETTELEKSFGAAVAFVDAKVNADAVNLIDNQVKIELYGLHRVAIEGSCFEPQPMALKVSARANWNSWKRLENLGREDAMEQYIALLSQHVPGWMGSHSSDKQ